MRVDRATYCSDCEVTLTDDPSTYPNLNACPETLGCPRSTVPTGDKPSVFPAVDRTTLIMVAITVTLIALGILAMIGKFTGPSPGRI